MQSKVIPPIDFYNLIAKGYDQKMNSQVGKELRLAVSNYFKSISNVKSILDFGAGTGEDLLWQIQAGYKIIFYEPSEAMATLAIQKHDFEKNQDITPLIGLQANLNKLVNKESNKLDAIFSNFAVLNSIEDLNDTFSVFSNILRVEGHFICIINRANSLGKKLKLIFPTLNIKLTSDGSSSISDDLGNVMPVYLHSKKEIKNYGIKHGFKLTNLKKMDNGRLILYHFTKH